MRSQSQLFLILLGIVIVVGIFAGRVIVSTPGGEVLFGAIALGVLFATFISPIIGLYTLIFSMLLSPETVVGSLPGRDIVVRLDEILLILITFTWLVRMAVYKELKLLKWTPLNRPIFVYILIMIISTTAGVFFGTVWSPLKGFFYTLRYIEYFLLFFLVANSVQNKRQIINFLTAFFITCLIISIYASSHIGEVGRVSAPFEGAGEPNTLGGYLVFMLALILGVYLYSSSVRIKFYLGGLALCIILPLLYTLSRASYLAIIPTYFTLIILSEKKKFLIGALLIAIMFSLVFMPEVVISRIKDTFISAAPFPDVKFAGISIGPSPAARVVSGRQALKDWVNHPVLGYGITGYGFLDNQYARNLVETGIIGLTVYLWLMFAIYKRAIGIYKSLEDRFYKGLTLGFIAGFIGLLTHALTANTFMILRIMEPFWFVAGIIMMIPRIIESEHQSTRKSIVHSP